MPRRAPPVDEPDLFSEAAGAARLEVATAVVLLRRYAATAPLRAAIAAIAAAAPFRHLRTPGGGTMSVAMTNCGAVGWHSDARGYRYLATDPETGRPWPAMPPAFAVLAHGAAAKAGFSDFEPDCCLVNRYTIGSQMGTHRDYDEHDMRYPIVSVSIGLPATFVWYGATRKGPPLALRLEDGDVLVWGGGARAGYHGVRRLPAPALPSADRLRFNLTFRRAR